MLIITGIIISILFAFGYHHFLTFQTYSVNETLEFKDKYSYRIDEIALFSQIRKEGYKGIEILPWYYKMNGLSMTWRNNIAKVDHFFSFPTMTASVSDDPSGFIVALKYDEKIKSLQSLRLQIGDTTIKWENLSKKEETHYFLSPFYSQREYIDDRKH